MARSTDATICASEHDHHSWVYTSGRQSDVIGHPLASTDSSRCFALPLTRTRR